jgi:hypothetical protein
MIFILMRGSNGILNKRSRDRPRSISSVGRAKDTGHLVG